MPYYGTYSASIKRIPHTLSLFEKNMTVSPLLRFYPLNCSPIIHTLYLVFFCIFVKCICGTLKTILYFIFSIFSLAHDIPVAVHKATHIYCKPSVSMPLHDFYLIMVDMAGTYQLLPYCFLHGESDCWLYSHFYYMYIVMVLLSTFICSSEMALALILFLF